MGFVIIYADQGVDGLALRHTVKSLQRELDLSKHPIRRMDAKQILQDSWQEDAALLVVPGGRDIFYHEALKKRGTEKIRDFVLAGGGYLGICAGGYFGASAIEFEKGHRLEVCAKRDLGFFPGLAIGPAYGLGKYSYENTTGAEAAQISWRGDGMRVYYNGGCYFQGADLYPQIEILSRYMDLPNTPASIIRQNIGKGSAILSGVHFEYSPSHRFSADAYLEKIFSLLTPFELQRRQLLRDVLSSFFLALQGLPEKKVMTKQKEFFKMQIE